MLALCLSLKACSPVLVRGPCLSQRQGRSPGKKPKYPLVDQQLHFRGSPATSSQQGNSSWWQPQCLHSGHSLSSSYDLSPKPSSAWLSAGPRLNPMAISNRICDFVSQCIRSAGRTDSARQMEVGFCVNSGLAMCSPNAPEMPGARCADVGDTKWVPRFVFWSSQSPDLSKRTFHTVYCWETIFFFSRTSVPRLATLSPYPAVKKNSRQTQISITTGALSVCLRFSGSAPTRAPMSASVGIFHLAVVSTVDCGHGPRIHLSDRETTG